ncbi:MAG: hypothetical protein KUG73_06570 [Pseudomonadales bacterium]|nr:hypothetical protein [Pseudomonadales bacterium]
MVTKCAEQWWINGGSMVQVGLLSPEILHSGGTDNHRRMGKLTVCCRMAVVSNVKWRVFATPPGS